MNGIMLGLISIFLYLICMLASLHDRKDDGYIEKLNNTFNKEVKGE